MVIVKMNTFKKDAQRSHSYNKPNIYNILINHYTLFIYIKYSLQPNYNIQVTNSINNNMKLIDNENN